MSQRKGNAFDQGVPGDPRLLDSINRRTPKAAGMAVTHTHGGTIHTPRRAKRTPSTGGPFCKVYQSATEWKLLGGTVTGGGTTETLADVTIGTIGTEPADGTFYWLVCDVTSNEEDDVLLPGCELTAVATGSGVSVPSNTLPAVGSLSGQIHISLGEWMGGKFTSSGCGNIQVSHCPGSLTYMRGVSFYEF